MAGVKISMLPVVLASELTDFAPFVQNGVTSRETLGQIATLFSGTLTLNSIAQVTGLPAALNGFLPLTGGTLSGPLLLAGNPVLANQAANKAYVDLAAGGFTVILATQAATTVNLNATQAGAGVGATLTNAGTQAAFVVDGYTASVNDRILVKNQTLSQHNGVYVVTNIGSGSTNWVLTRAADYDTAAQIKPGTLIAVNNGTVNATTSWLETATVVTVDTDPILFSQFTFAPSAFFQIVNNLSEGVPSTMRTNLGLGSVAVKNATDATQTLAVMANGATTIGHVAVFSDVNGTIQDGGAPSGTVTSIATAGLASGGPITGTGTITVTAAIKTDQITGTSTTVAVVPAVQQFHMSAGKAWVSFQGNPIVIFSSYNVSGVVRNSTGIYTITFTTPFTSAANYAGVGSHSSNSGSQSSVCVSGYTASTVTLLCDIGSGLTDPARVNFIAFGLQ